jgi:hypothetical protein
MHAPIARLRGPPPAVPLALARSQRDRPTVRSDLLRRRTTPTAQPTAEGIAVTTTATSPVSNVQLVYTVGYGGQEETVAMMGALRPPAAAARTAGGWQRLARRLCLRRAAAPCSLTLPPAAAPPPQATARPTPR